MLGILYLVITILLGWYVCGPFLGKSVNSENWSGNNIWLYIPASIGTGVIFTGWTTYLVSRAASVWGNFENPLIIGNTVTMVSVMLIFAGLWYRGFKKERLSEKLITDKKLFTVEAVFFVLMMLFFTWILFYVFHAVNGRLYSGFTVFGDYAPHTAMMRSFSLENNYPTQYPHFGGEDVKYHFMFQFLVGNLEFLGMRIDVAYNVLSSLVLEGFIMLLYSLVQRIIKSVAAGIITVFFFLFRSSISFWIYAWENLKAGTLWQALTTNTLFIGYTPNENWGLWNFNVYLNQRHLALGMIVVAFVIWLYLDRLEVSMNRGDSGIIWIKNRMFAANAWRFQKPSTAVFAGILLGACSFWNGAAVIGGLLILFGFAACSDGKLDYALTALITILLSFLQTSAFIDGNSMKVSFYWGFIAEDKSLFGVIKYLFIMSGVFFLGILIPMLAFAWKERTIMCAFLLPTVFAFTISLTPDINVNHKYIMISYAFLSMFWAGVLVQMWRRFWGLKFAAVILAVLLTVTGIYDFVVILLDNDKQHRVSVNLESNLTKWLSDTLEHDDLLLTPQYSMNEITMSGVMLYSGWPYYAWSAGYNTYYRAERAVEIYTSDDTEYVNRLIEEEKISYIVYEDDMTYEQHTCREDIIAEICTLVFTTDDGRIRIYES